MRWTVGIYQDEESATRFFTPEDLARLATVADIRYVPRVDRRMPLDALGDIDLLLGSWGAPKLDSELLDAAPKLKARAMPPAA